MKKSVKGILSAFLAVALLITGIACVPIGELFTKEALAADPDMANTRVTRYVAYDSESNMPYYTKTYTYDPKGNVTEKTYDDNTEGGSHFTYRYKCDSACNLTEKAYYGESANSVTKYKYDSSNRLISETYEWENGTDYNSSKTTYIYDSKGRLSKEQSGSVTRVYVYDAKNRLIKEGIKHSGSSKTEYDTFYEYDAKGNCTSLISYYDPSDTRYYYAENNYYSYDSNGRIVYEYTYFGELKENEEWWSGCSLTYSYYKSGKLKSCTIEYDDGLKVIRKYDERGNLTVDTSVYDGYNYDTYYSYYYDAAGKLVKATTEDDSGYISSTKKYIYDKNNGLIREDSFCGTSSVKDSQTYYTNFDLGAKKFNISNLSMIVEGNYYAYLSKKSYVYDGKAHYPNVVFANEYGNIDLRKGKDYLVSYSSNKAIGTGKVKITFIGTHANIAPITLTFKIVPPAVKGLKTKSRTTSSVTLGWDKVNGASTYEVYMYNSSTGKYVKKATVGGTSATVKDLKAGTSYKFKVRAVDSTGNAKGAYSSVLTTCTKCKAPTNVKVTSPAKKCAKITWSKVTGATSYSIYYATSKNGEYKLLKTVTGTAYTHSSFASGSTRYIKVVANKKVGSVTVKSAYSKIVSVKIK